MMGAKPSHGGEFAPAALSPVILAYRQTNEFVEREIGAYDSPVAVTPEAAPLHLNPQQPVGRTIQVTPKIHIDQDDGRTIFRYDFEGGEWLRFEASPKISTEEALAMAETLIALKRKELQRISQTKENTPEAKEGG
jgi:hypothetical protein